MKVYNYRKIFLAFIITYITYYLVCMLFIALNYRDDFCIQIGFVLVVLGILWIVFFNKKMNNATMSHLEPLRTRCDVQEYICVLKQVLDESKNSKLPIYKIIKLSKASAYLLLGEYEECKRVLDEFNFKKIFLKKRQLYFTYCRLMCTYYINVGDEQSASKEIKYIREKYGDKRNCYFMKVLEARYAVMKEKYDDAELFFTESLKHSKNLYDQVFCSFFLGMIYARRNDERAVIFLEYVIENGNNLIFVKQAKSLLDGM